jgi:hypothetical protein
MHGDPKDHLVDGAVAFLRELPDDEFLMVLLRARGPEPIPPDHDSSAVSGRRVA